MNTEKLINILAKDLKPDKPVAPPVRQLLPSGLILLPTMLLYLFFRTGNFTWLVIPSNAVEIILLLLIFYTASWLSVRYSLPGSENKNFLAALLLLVSLWTASLGFRLFTGQASYSNPGNYHFCIEDVTLISFIPFLLLVRLLRKNYAVQPLLNFFILLVAAASLALLAVEFMCPDKNPLHIFKAHYLPAVLFILALLPFKKLIAPK